MFDRNDPHSATEFIILGVFGAVVCVGLLYGAVVVVKNRGLEQASAPVARQDVPAALPMAPTAEEYDGAAAEVMAPFLAQAAQVTDASFVGDVSALGALVAKTEDRMVRLRIPAERKDTHLAAVLLLGRWKRAVAGSVQDRAEVVAATAEFVKTAPWSAR